ncbi:MAG: transporter substrate-binding domain-containing protein [Pseudomonadota bacterium]
MRLPICLFCLTLHVPLYGHADTMIAQDQAVDGRIAGMFADGVEQTTDSPTLTAVINGFRPYGYLDHAGRPVGLGVDILDAIARRADFEVRYIVRDNVSDAIGAVSAGDALLHPALADVPERRRVLAFSQPYDTLRVAVFRPVDSTDPPGDNAFAGLRLGFNRGSIAEFATNALPDVTPVALSSNDDVLLALAEGKIDGAVYPKRAFERLARAFEVEEKYRVAGEPLREIELRIAVDKNQTALLARLDKTLAELRSEPAWNAMRNRWFPPAPPYWNRHRILVAAAVMMGMLALGAAALVFREREVARNRLLRESQDRIEMERMLAAQQAEANQLLTRHNREMQSILYVVSHDLKSPLVSIGGFARKAEKALDRADAETGREALTRVRSNVETMGKLISGILQLSRIGRERLSPAAIDWPLLIERLNVALASQLEERQARIEVVGTPPPIIADPTLFYRLVQNLVSNALDHGCPEPGMSVRLEGRSDDEWHYLSVSDNGPGIAPEFHERIFGLFQRLDRGTDGTGIGLATVLNIAERHGGQVTVVSSPGEGATFRVHLPVAPTLLPSAPVAVEKEEAQALPRIGGALGKVGRAA